MARGVQCIRETRVEWLGTAALGLRAVKRLFGYLGNGPSSSQARVPKKPLLLACWQQSSLILNALSTNLKT